MTFINIKGFKGKVPRTSERLLQGNYATEALNVRLTSGRLDPIKGLTLVHTSLASAVTSMFRYRNSGVDYWLVWNRVVDAVRSPSAQDARNRVYYTGDGEPRMSSYADAISGGGPYPAAFFVLGVYAPTTSMAVSPTGGSGTQESRAYKYTFVTQYGEESAGSPATLVTGFANATSWNITGMEVAPPNTGAVTAATTIGTGVVEVTLDTVRGLSAYEEIKFASVVGMTDLNGTFPLLAVNTATNKVQVQLTTAQTYTSGGTWARIAPHNTANMKKRIYRTTQGSTSYQFVAEILATATTYSDTTAGSALGEVISSDDNTPPPKNGHSLVALANGSLAMLAGNQICLSKQYVPHSWPMANRYAFSGTGVAACAAGNSVIVLTDTYPVIATASTPDAASVARLPVYAPCVAKTGVVDAGVGCIYPSHDGLYFVSPSDVQNLTDKLYRHEEWQQVNPSTFKAAFYDQRYYAMHSAGASGKMLVLDINAPDSVAEVADVVDALYANPYDGKLYVSKGNRVYEWDSDNSNRYLMFYQSPEFQLGGLINFSCAQVQARYSDIVPPDTSIQAANAALLALGADAIEGAIGATVIGVYPLGATNLLEVPVSTANRVQFSLLSKGEVKFTKELNSSEPFRLPGTFRSDLYQIQISASVPIYLAAVAQSMEELQEATT